MTFGELTTRRIWPGATCAIGALGYATSALAGGGALQPAQSTLTTLVTALTGPISTAVAVLAVIACGFMAFAGRLAWGMAASVIMGITLVFGSAQIVQLFQSAVGK